jgi:hypothetical protein
VSLEQLEDTNHVRFLRKKYKDPMTGEAVWRLVHFGEAQIVIPAPNPGLNSNTTNPGLTPSSGVGGPPPGGNSNQAGNNAGLSAGQPAQTPPQANGNTLGTLTTSNIGNGQTVGGGQIIGVASVNKGQAIKEFNEKDHYDEWFFVYDLRLEQSGGTGVAVAAPRGAAGTAGAPGAVGVPSPSPTAVPTPPPLNK